MLKRYNGVTEEWEAVSNVGVYNLISTMKIYAQCTVQLFNGANEEVYSESGRAVIFPSLYVMLKRMMLSLLTYNTNLSGIQDTVSTSTNNFLKYLILTDSNLPLSSTEYNIPGTIINSADKTTTSSATNGLINLTESFVSDKQAHWVFDFSADKANTAFQSVCMGYQLTNGYAYGYDLDFLTPAKRVYSHIGYGDDYFWGSTGTTTIYKIDPNTFEELEEYTMPSVAYGLTVYNGYVYYMYDVFTMYKVDLDTLSYSTLALGTALRSAKEHICNDTTYIYTHKDSSSEVRRILISTFEPELDPDTTFTLQGLPYPYSFFMHKGFIYSIDLDDKVYKINPYTESFETLNIWYIRSKPMTSNNTNIYTLFNNNSTSANNNAWYKLDLNKGNLNLGARKLLANPITKTNTQTMKITYDFIMN